MKIFVDSSNLYYTYFMKILIATGIFPPEIGGPATYAALLAEKLPQNGFEIEVLPFRAVRKYPRVLRHFIYFFKVLLKSRKADIVFTQDPVSTGIPVVCASFLSRKKVVMRVAGDYAWEQSRQRFDVTDSIEEFQNKRYSLPVEFLRFLQRIAVRYADLVITPSDYFNKLVSGWNNGKKEIITIYNGIDLSVEFNGSSKFADKTIISAGRLVPWKGFDLLIEVLEEMSDWKLLIAGDGPDKYRLQEMISSKGLNNRVTLLGNIPRKELLESISKSHVFVLLSTFESFSFQIVEAMHAGAPVIAGDICNISEIVENGKDGLLINPTDKIEVINTIRRLYTDPNLKNTLIRNAKIKSRKFSIEKTLDGLVKVFNDIQ